MLDRTKCSSNYRCFCGNSLGNTNVYQKKNESECNQKCSGDSSQTCGGQWHSSVYEFITATLPTTKMTTEGHSSETRTPRQSTITITEVITLGQSEDTTNGVECLCPCSKNVEGKWDFLRGMNLTLDQLREVMKPELDLMKKELSVNKSNTTRMRRSKMSAPDDRVSATSVGYVGVVFICFIAVLIVFIDILGCFVAKFEIR